MIIFDGTWVLWSKGREWEALKENRIDQRRLGTKDPGTCNKERANRNQIMKKNHDVRQRTSAKPDLWSNSTWLQKVRIPICAWGKASWYQLFWGPISGYFGIFSPGCRPKMLNCKVMHQWLPSSHKVTCMTKHVLTTGHPCIDILDMPAVPMYVCRELKSRGVVWVQMWVGMQECVIQ